MSASKWTTLNQENMATLESKWGEIKRALMLTVRLVDSFGFYGTKSDRTQRDSADLILSLSEEPRRLLSYTQQFRAGTERRFVNGSFVAC